MRAARRAIAAAALALLAAGCYRPSPAPLRVVRADSTIALCERTIVAAATDSAAVSGGVGCGRRIALTYLGVGGFVIRSDSFALMTAPSFTNPRLLRVNPVTGRFLTIASRPAIVDSQLARLRAQRPEALRGVNAILVGHGHYDHLLDVPYVQRQYVPEATVYGSATVANLLAGDRWVREHGRTAVIDDSAGGQGMAGKWVYPEGGRFRFMPLRVRHAPNANAFASRRVSYTVAKGAVPAPLDTLPRRARDWKLGPAYAYLIDVLGPDGRTPVFRVLYQDAASPPAYNHLPPGLGRDTVDVAIVCVGSAGNVVRYPASVFDGMKPRYVVLGHWENFFHPASADPGVIPFTDTKELERLMEQRAPRQWATPAPRTTFTFVY